MENVQPSDSRLRSRPKMLFLCQTLPFPPDGGAAIRTYNILKLLSRTYDISALCFRRRGYSDAEVAGAVEGLTAYARVEAFPIAQDGSRARTLWDHLRSTLSGKVYTRFVHRSPEMSARIAELIAAEPFELAHVDSLDLSGFLPLLRGLPVICVHHNVESSLLRRRAQLARNRATRFYIRHQSMLMEREERTWCPRVAMNVMVSTEDAALLRAMVPTAVVTVVPNGVDTAVFAPTEGPQAGLVFAGGMSWFPNRDALDFFCESILPRIRAKWTDPLPVAWVGRVDESVRSLYSARFGVNVTGYVPDIRPVVAGAACYVVPLRVGGGTRLKILDAWAMGKAIVSTSVGCEGLEARDGENILIRDDPEDFATAVVQVLADSHLRRRLERGAREIVERHYSWDVIATGLHADYEAVRLRRTRLPADVDAV